MIPMRLCIVCGKTLNRKGRLCRTCESNKYMTQRYDEYKNYFENDNTPLGQLIFSFINYLDSSYGDQKREIAYRIRYTLEAFNKGEIAVKDKWSIEDVLQIENYRHGLSIQRKTALHHFIQYLISTYNLKSESEELRIIQVIKNIPLEFQEISKKYLDFLLSYRKLKHWTRLQIAYSLKYFFTHLTVNYKLIDVRQITNDHILSYISYLLTNNSQKNAYIRFREIATFFKWAQRYKLTFGNPCKNIDVDYGHKPTQGLSEERQRELIKRWLDMDTDPREAVIGILGLLYACSSEEIRNLKIFDLQDGELKITGRPINIIFPKKIREIINRYLLWRQSICKGAKNDYFLVSKISYKKNCPVSDSSFRSLLKDTGLSPRDFRATRIHDIASTGNVKLLEGLGLTYEGIKTYLRIATPVLLMGHKIEQ